MELNKTNAWHWDDGIKFDGEQDAVWGVVEQANECWAVLLEVPGGVMTPSQFSVVGGIVADGGLAVKFTRREAPIILLPKEKVASAIDKLRAEGMRIANVHGSVRNIVACPGKGLCKQARQDTLGLAKEISDELYAAKLPWDFKIGISGCPRNCSATLCQCLGLMAEPRGMFTISLGGKESGRAETIHGQVIPVKIPRAKVIPVIKRVLQLYNDTVDAQVATAAMSPQARLYHVIQVVGLKPFIDEIEEELKQ